MSCIEKKERERACAKKNVFVCRRTSIEIVEIQLVLFLIDLFFVCTLILTSVLLFCHPHSYDVKTFVVEQLSVLGLLLQKAKTLENCLLLHVQLLGDDIILLQCKGIWQDIIFSSYRLHTLTTTLNFERTSPNHSSNIGCSARIQCNYAHSTASHHQLHFENLCIKQ